MGHRGGRNPSSLSRKKVPVYDGFCFNYLGLMDLSFFVDLMVRSYPLMLMGALMTIKVLVVSAAISFLLGIFFGVFACEEIRVPVFSPLVQFTTFILRAVPFYVQLLIVYFVLPDFIGVNLEIFSASVIALGVCSSGYVCQIVRAGINSIPQVQWETAYVLGYNKLNALLFIILPQMFRNVLPAFNNELESILKSTSILAAIGMLELTRIGMNIVSRELKHPLTIYLIVAMFYVAMSATLNFAAKYLEKRMLRKVKYMV